MKNIKEELQNMREKVEKFGVIKLLLILIAIIAIFQAGIFVGYHKAMFYKSAGYNYYKQGKFDDKKMGDNMSNKNGERMSNFNRPDEQNPKNQFGKFMMEMDVPGGHGAVGKIVSINLPNIIIASPDNIEKTVTVSNDTLIREFRETIKSEQLKIGDIVAVIGEISASDDGLIKAKLIRILPPIPEENSKINE